MEYFVSPYGNDENAGTDPKLPFRTIRRGLQGKSPTSKLKAGDVLTIRRGVYVEALQISNTHGTSKAPIIIRSFPGEKVYIDGCLPEFLIKGGWELASKKYKYAHKDEYVSVNSFSGDILNSGAFGARSPYTRLITYSTLYDLRAINETFELIMSPDIKRPGAKLVGPCKATEDDDEDVPETPVPPTNKISKPVQCYYPFVYMGPGIWFNRKTGRLHIRLSHTHNAIAGLADYQGEINPNKLRLAISPQGMTTLSIIKSEYLHFENLTIRFGGDDTITLKNVEGLVFDHVKIRAARRGLRMGGMGATRTRDTVFRHCEFDGGLPTWFFRSDRKAEYSFLLNGQVYQNSLGKNTLEALIVGNPNDTGTQIYNCEFHDAHDLYLHGADLVFHHNWIHNLNDEGMFLDDGTQTQTQVYNMKIYQNVITQVLSAISFAGNHLKGNWYIYRNLVDLRSPTAGHRPRKKGDKNVWRYGHVFKTIDADGPRDLFQNTFLVYGQKGHAAYRNYDNLAGNQLRRTFNNIFVAVNPDPDSDKALAYLPTPAFPGPTDGNDYYRIGLATKPLFRYNAYTFNGEPACKDKDPDDPQKSLCSGGKFFTLNALRGSPPSLLFLQSKSQYPPGYEAKSMELDPSFCSIDPDGVFRETDDLRLASGSLLIGAGIKLPLDLKKLDPLAPPSKKPDIGCYPAGSPPLQVGVDGGRSYPGK